MPAGSTQPERLNKGARQGHSRMQSRELSKEPMQMGNSSRRLSGKPSSNSRLSWRRSGSRSSSRLRQTASGSSNMRRSWKPCRSSQQQLQARREEQLQQQQASSYQIEGVKDAQSQESSAAALSEEALGNGAAGDAQTGEPGAAQNPQSQQQQKSATHYDSIDPMESRRSQVLLAAPVPITGLAASVTLAETLCLVTGHSLC